MPTFKSICPDFDPAVSDKDNLMNLFDFCKGLSSDVTRTINNLDEDNLNDDIVSLLRGGTENEQSDS